MERKLEFNTPLSTFYNEIKAVFGRDPDINIEYDADENEIKMRVTGQEKAEALTKILPSEKKFGNVTVKVTVIQQMNSVRQGRTSFRKRPKVIRFYRT